MNWFAGLRGTALARRIGDVHSPYREDRGPRGPREYARTASALSRGSINPQLVRRGQRCEELQQVRALVFRNYQGVALRCSAI